MLLHHESVLAHEIDANDVWTQFLWRCQHQPHCPCVLGSLSKMTWSTSCWRTRALLTHLVRQRRPRLLRVTHARKGLVEPVWDPSPFLGICCLMCSQTRLRAGFHVLHWRSNHASSRPQRKG